jgi:hypothetical protein
VSAAQIRFFSLVRREVNRFMKIKKQTIGAPLLETFLYISVFGAALGSRGTTRWKRSPGGTGSRGSRPGATRAFGNSGPAKIRRCSVADRRWNTKLGRIRTTRMCSWRASNASSTRSTYAFSRPYAAVGWLWVGHDSVTACRGAGE